MKNYDDLKILIAVPSMDMVNARFAQSLACLQKVGKCSVSFILSSLIYDARNKFAIAAIKNEYDYVMWFDSDMTFAPDTLVKLLDDDKDIVSGLYFRRTSPYTPVLFKDIQLTESMYEGNKIVHYNDYPKDSLFEVAAVGFGCILVKTKVFADIILDCGTIFEPMNRLGEDIAFCVRAKNAGYKVYCDSRIKCGHIGYTESNEEFFENCIQEDLLEEE